MSTFIPREEAFVCLHCKESVLPLGGGTYRDHRPLCLHGLHVDLNGPGDRQNPCQGVLAPVGIDHDGKKGFVIVYRCGKCKRQLRNKAAPDDRLDVWTPDPSSLSH